MEDRSFRDLAKLPKISIGIVVYNGVEHISRVLESVAKQPYQNIELIVVDGGSTDGTLAILDEYSKHISVMVSEPDKGIYDAMNKVCSLATGDWLIFLGCDDVLLESFSEIPGHLANPDAVYYGDAVFRSSNSIVGGKVSKYRMMNSNICHQAIFYPRSVYRNRLYSLRYKWLADYAYNIKLLGDGVPFVYLAQVVSIFNDRGGSSQGDVDFERDRLKLIRESFGIHYWILKLARSMLAGIARMIRSRNSRRQDGPIEHA